MPPLCPDACAAACGFVVAAPLWRGGDHDGADAGGRDGRAAPPRRGRRAGMGPTGGADADGAVVAVPVRRAADALRKR